MVDFADKQFERGEPQVRLRPRAPSVFGGGRRLSARSLRRFALAGLTLCVTLVLFAAIGTGLLFVVLSRGPIAVGLEKQVSKALAARVKHGFRFNIGGTDIQSADGRPALIVHQLVVQDEAGRPVLRAPEATLSVDPVQLLAGSIVPTRLDLQDLTLKLVILPDGDVALSAGTDETLPFRLAEAFEGASPGPVQASTVPARLPSEAVPTGKVGDAFDRLAASLVPLLDAFTGTDDGFAGFDRLGIARGQLIVDDRAHNSTETFRNLAFAFERPSDGAARMTMAANGGGLRWSVAVNVRRNLDGSRLLDAELHNVTTEDLRLVPGLRDPGFDTDLALAGSVELQLDKSGALTGLSGHVGTGAGYFHLDDPDHEPLQVNAIDLPFRFDADKRALDTDAATIKVETADYTFGGKLLPPTAPAAAWSFTGDGHGTVGPERPNESPIKLDRIKAALRISPDAHRVDIDHLSIAGPQVAMALTGAVQGGPGGVHVSTKASAGHMPAPVLLRLWPSTISAPVRSWLLQNLGAGSVDSGTATANLDSADLAKMKLGRSVADSHVQVDYAVSGITLAFMDGVPPMRGLSGSGYVTGDTSKFNVAHATMDVGQARQLSLTDGSLFVPTTDPRPTPALITAHVAGGLDALSDLLSRDALKSYAGLPPELASAKGQIDGNLSLGLDLGARPKSDDVKVTANAKVTGLAIDKVVGKQSLTDGTVLVTLDKSGAHATGTAMVAGAPTTLDIKKPSGTAPGEANVVMTFDDAARAKAGFGLGKSLTGPVSAKITAAVGGPDKKATIDLDLSRATLSNLVPGLSKPAGRPGHVVLVATQHDNTTELDHIAGDIGNFSLHGSATLDGGGALQTAKLTQLRISPGDDMKADITQNGDGLKLVVRGTNLDARPFIKSLSDPDGSDGDKDLDLDLHTGVLTGQNSQVMTGVDLKLVRHGGQMRKVDFKGKIGRASVEIGSAMQGSVLALMVASGDAGGLLDFLDLYKRLDGGRLDTTIRMLNGHWDGSAVVRDFGLREDPALKKLTEESLTEGKGDKPHLDASNLSFQKMSVVFSKNGSKIDVKEGSLYSPEIGATVQGSIDFGHDKLALNGTFVPIYGVNNLFAQVPLVGPILGGGANEGLFGLNYKINGSVANPNLSIDPLSALAPGFLRKIFGAITEATETPSPSPSKPGTGFDPVAR